MPEEQEHLSGRHNHCEEVHHHEPCEKHDHLAHHKHMVAEFRRRFWVSLILTIPVVVLSEMIQSFFGLEGKIRFRGDGLVQFVFATVVFFYGGWPFLRGLYEELREKNPGMMTLVGLAITVAYLYSSMVVFGLAGEVFYWEITTLIDIMLLGHWIEMRSVLGASGALEDLVRLIPSEAHRIRDSGTVEDVQVSELEKGDRVLVKPGEKIPSDGVIVEGRTTVNQAMLTGESSPVEKGEGDEVIAGAINGESAVTVEVRKTGDEVYLAQVVEMVRRANQSRSRTQDLADRAAFWLTIGALTASAITIGAWLGAGRGFAFSLERAVTVMVITCPHALGVAIPVVVAISTSLAAQRGLLIRERGAFERARKINAIVFDKTGTLTEGRFGVTDVVSFGDHTEDEVLRLAAGVESQSEHPIAAGIIERAKQRNIDFTSAKDFKTIPGKGARGTVGGSVIKVVSTGYLEENKIGIDNYNTERLAREGKTIAYVLVDDHPIGIVALADVIRPTSREAVKALKGFGMQVMMVTGDSEAVARSVSGELGLDDYFAQVLPDKKAEKIRQIRKLGFTVAMVGDGINDAPALVEADIGIAIGAGTDIAIESADIVLVRSDPRDVTAIIGLAKASYAKMVQNLWWAAGYNIIAVPLAAGVLYWAGIILPPAVGAVIMSLSTVIVVINARLLGRTGEKSAGEAKKTNLSQCSCASCGIFR